MPSRTLQARVVEQGQDPRLGDLIRLVLKAVPGVVRRCVKRIPQVRVAVRAAVSEWGGAIRPAPEAVLAWDHGQEKRDLILRVREAVLVLVQDLRESIPLGQLEARVQDQDLKACLPVRQAVIHPDHKVDRVEGILLGRGRGMVNLIRPDPGAVKADVPVPAKKDFSLLDRDPVRKIFSHLGHAWMSGMAEKWGRGRAMVNLIRPDPEAVKAEARVPAKKDFSLLDRDPVKKDLIRPDLEEVLVLDQDREKKDLIRRDPGAVKADVPVLVKKDSIPLDLGEVREWGHDLVKKDLILLDHTGGQGWVIPLDLAAEPRAVRE